jgi:uncharacterized protein YbjT (DUF2867 family)
VRITVSADNQFTILGASGFIGSALVASLTSQDRVVHAVTRAALPGRVAVRFVPAAVIDAPLRACRRNPRGSRTARAAR